MRRTIDSLVKKLSDNGEAAIYRGFPFLNLCVNRSVCTTEKRYYLVDTERRISVERERKTHLTAGEVLFVEWRSIGVYWLEIAASASNTIGIFPRDDALLAAAWTGRILPELFESPLVAGVERLRVDLDDA